MAATLKMQRDPVTGVITGHISGTYTAATEAVSSGPSQTFSASTLTTRQADGNNTQGAALASGVLTVTPGFIPRYAKIINVTDRVTQEWHKGMNQGDFLETAANGTRTLETDDKLVVNETTGVVTFTADGTAITDNDTSVFEIRP